MKKYQYILITIYLLHNSLEANDNVYNVKEEEYDILHIEEDTYPKECTDILEEFAQNVANFTLCSIMNAKPVRLCEKCIDEYVNSSKKYQQLLDTVVNGSTCGSYFISRDRIDVVMEYHNHIRTVWDKGHCNDCFDFSNGTHQLSNNTIRFNKMAKDTMDCIISNKNSSNKDQVCVICMQSYLQLNDFYGSLSKDSIGVDSVCMDIVDTMNSTRSIWSKSLNCCKMRKSPEIIFLCCTAVISLLPLLYYIAVRYCGPIRDLPNVLKESRFKQSILVKVNSWKGKRSP